MTRLVIVGNGMVGSRFAEDLLTADRANRFDVTVLGAEPCEPYNRVLLSEVVAGTHDMTSLTLPAPRSDRLTVRSGAEVLRIDREDRAVVTADGSRYRYDQLVLATGSSARIPPLAGLDAQDSRGELPAGVHSLRTIDDAREIVAATLNARRAVVLGAGVLGMEAACGLARRGVEVTVVHPMAALMERQLDGDASRVVEEAMARLGLDHRVGVGAEAVVLGEGRVRAVRLGSGEVLETSLLVLATGTIANTELASAAGLSTGRGVLVDEQLASVSDRRIFAIGDCAQPPEGGSGLVAQGWAQSRRLAASLCAAGAASVPDSPTSGTDVVRLKAHGLDVVTMGVCGSQRADDPAQRTLRLSDPDLGRHVEVVVSGGLLVGATCVGAGPVAADLVTAYTRRTPIPADPAYLMLPALAGATAGMPTHGADPVSLPDDATVCRCNGVTKGSLASCIHDGASTVEEVAAATRATTGCGGCAEDVCALLEALSPAGSPERENRFTKGKHMTNIAEIVAT